MRSVLATILGLCVSGCVPAGPACHACQSLMPGVFVDEPPRAHIDDRDVAAGPCQARCGRGECVQSAQVDGGMCLVRCSPADDRCRDGTRCTAVRDGSPVCILPQLVPSGGLVAQPPPDDARFRE